MIFKYNDYFVSYPGYGDNFKYPSELDEEIPSETPGSPGYDSNSDPEYILSSEDFFEIIPKIRRSSRRTVTSAYKSSTSQSFFPDSISSSTSNINHSDTATVECDPISYAGTSTNLRVKKSISSSVPKRIREKDHCYYCKCFVGNFARHLQRRHSNEIDVQEFMKIDPNSKQRKAMINLLRNKGNALINSSQNCVKPVKKPHTLIVADTDYLQCVYCYGYYVKKQLWRHKRKCYQNPKNQTSSEMVVTHEDL